MRREGDKVDKNGGIHGYGVIEECDSYMLHKVNVVWGKQGGVVGVVSVLDFVALCGGFPGMWGILRARRLMVL